MIETSKSDTTVNKVINTKKEETKAIPKKVREKDCKCYPEK